MPNEVFTKHHQDPVPIHRNTLPVAECSVHNATVGGKPCKAIDVPILGCASVWLRVQKEAEAWITVDGKLIEDRIRRNRQINKAYAQLWQADHRFQWAGLAAFASKQVGCGLLHAADNVRKSQEEMQMNQYRSVMNSGMAATNDAVPSLISASSAYMYDQLALGNTTLFLDIYPLHRFYMLRGLLSLQECLPERETIAGKVIWPIDKNKLSFGKPFAEILGAFSLIEANRIDESVRKMAYHEQINILQSAIYDDFAMRRALDANQFSWVSGFPSGLAAEIELTLSAECRSQSSSLNVWFKKSKTAKLYLPDQRMPFVYEAATRFDSLLKGSGRTGVEVSIGEIARNGGQ